MRTTIASAAVALSAAALTVGIPGVAHAELYGIDDPQDTFHGSDVRSLSVKNGQQNLHVVTDHDGLRRDPATGSRGLVYVDTDDADRGPEYVVVASYTAGGDFTVAETEGFGREQWGEPVEQGDAKLEVRYARERVHLTLSRHAIGDPTDVRVAVRVAGNRTDGTSHGLVDWVGEQRGFTPWIAQGW